MRKFSVVVALSVAASLAGTAAVAQSPAQAPAPPIIQPRKCRRSTTGP